MAYQAQGYSRAEIARMLGIATSTVQRDIKRAESRIPAQDTDKWRKVQLLRLERLYAACEAVLTAHHVVVSNGVIVREAVLDDEGRPIWDPVYGPDGEQLVDGDGQPRVEQRRVPLEDHAAVLDAVAEMRKIEAEITKLLGTQATVKQEVAVQHATYAIEGVDMSKIFGTDK